MQRIPTGPWAAAAAHFTRAAFCVELLLAGCSSNTASDPSGASAVGGVSGRADAGASSAGGGSAGALSTAGGTSPGGASNRAGAPATGGTDQATGTGGTTDNAAGGTSAAAAADFATEHDTYGSAASTQLETAGPAQGGNVIQMNRAMILRGFTQQLKLTTDQKLSFFVYEANQINGPYVFRWSGDIQETAGEARMVGSPPLDLPLEVNKFYWIGVSMPATGTFYYGSHGANYFASSALANILFASAGTLGSSISLYMPPPPEIDEPVIQTIELSLP